MARPRFTTDAYRDLEDIVLYVDVLNPIAAKRLLDRLEAGCWRLARNPGIGKRRRDLARDLRFFPVGSYLIFYTEIAEGIQVIRVLHGARDYGAIEFG